MKYRMRCLEIPILVIILVAGMAASAIAGEDAPKAPEATKAPKAVAESGIYNFGTVPEGKTVKAEFTIKNTGNADLVVEKVKTGWGCTKAASPDKPIPPGEEGIISVLVATRGYGGKELHKTVRVITNDPENKEIKLDIKGRVNRLAIITPSRVVLTGFMGEKISRTVEITPNGDKSFNIVKIAPQVGKDIAVSLNEKKESGHKVYELTVENTRKTEGRYYDKIVILTDQSDYPPLTIIVSGYIRPKPEENKG